MTPYPRGHRAAPQPPPVSPPAPSSACRILLTTDLHANLPAAEAAVQLARQLGVDGHWHLGDALDIGPWPRDTLDLLLSEGVRLIKGNHEEFATSRGIGALARSHMKQGELDHLTWTRARLDTEHLKTLENLADRVTINLQGPQGGPALPILLQHYAFRDGRVSEVWHDLDKEDLTALFDACGYVAVFFGHIHRSRTWQTAGTDFRSLASAGCSMDGRPGSGKTAVLVEAGPEGLALTSHELSWDTRQIHTELLRRKVPDHELIRDWFFR